MFNDLLKVTRRLFFGVALLAATLWYITTPVFAGTYGTGQYGTCIYEDCTPVVVTTPSGLEVAINLHDDQSIPSNGYTVTITPLNGAGSSFKEARIYLEGVLIKTVTPDPDGTARWLWVPDNQPGTHIKIDIVDTTNAVTTHSFTVAIGPPLTTTPSSNTNSSDNQTPQDTTNNNVATGPLDGLLSFIDGIGNGAQQTYHELQRIVQDLPPPVAEAFPYFLFLLLGLNLLILFLHFQRELRELRAYQALLAQARQLAEQKQVFISLISHYLRTPVTVLAGGVELLDPTDQRRTVETFRPIIDRIRTKIDTLLQQTRMLDTRVSLDRQLARVPAFWRQLNLFLPLVCIGLILVLYNVLALNVGKFSHSEVQIIAQLTIFVALVFATYQIFRRRYLSAHDRKLAEELVHQEEELAGARDTFMANAVQSLGADTRDLEAAKSALNNVSDPDKVYITQGTDRLRTVIEEFATAESLRGIRASRPKVSVPLSKLVRDAQAMLKPGRGASGANIVVRDDQPIETADAGLLARALSYVLANALEYSPPSSQVVVSGSKGGIVVHDNGAGIPPEKLPFIFQPFYKAEGSQSFNHEGMGFSLYLDKIIMTYLGGGISLDSKPGQGTTVTLAA